jgi:hypothetical protein
MIGNDFVSPYDLLLFTGLCLEWSACKQYLASGASDHRVLVWGSHSLSPVQNYATPVATVKGIYASLCYLFAVNRNVTSISE